MSHSQATAALGAPIANLSFGAMRSYLHTAQRRGIGMMHTARPFSIYRKVFYGGRSQRSVLSQLAGKRIVDVGCGFTPDNAANIVMAHVLAMFVPSFFTGHLINRFGTKPIIATGLTILVLAAIIALAGVELMNFYGALILLGIGWNFGFIGATTMLAGQHSPEERGRVQGLNDFLLIGFMMFASLLSGGLMNCVGTDPVAGWNAVSTAMLPTLTLAFIALLWFGFRSRRT